jgi:hypothetical protein
MAMTQQVSPRIALRMIVDGSADVASATWLQVRDVLVGLGAVDEPTIKAYGKFPDSQEISCTLQPTGVADDAYEEVAHRLGSGWADHTNDRFARWTVWNRGDGLFITPSVRWAHIELIRG